jgi:hypothetical protein
MKCGPLALFLRMRCLVFVYSAIKRDGRTRFSIVLIAARKMADRVDDHIAL